MAAQAGVFAESSMCGACTIAYYLYMEEAFKDTSCNPNSIDASDVSGSS